MNVNSAGMSILVVIAGGGGVTREEEGTDEREAAWDVWEVLSTDLARRCRDGAAANDLPILDALQAAFRVKWGGGSSVMANGKGGVRGDYEMSKQSDNVAKWVRERGWSFKKSVNLLGGGRESLASCHTHTR